MQSEVWKLLSYEKQEDCIEKEEDYKEGIRMKTSKL